MLAIQYWPAFGCWTSKNPAEYPRERIQPGRAALPRGRTRAGLHRRAHRPLRQLRRLRGLRHRRAGDAHSRQRAGPARPDFQRRREEAQEVGSRRSHRQEFSRHNRRTSGGANRSSSCSTRSARCASATAWLNAPRRAPPAVLQRVMGRVRGPPCSAYRWRSRSTRRCRSADTGKEWNR